MPNATASPSHGQGAERRSEARHVTASGVNATLTTTTKGPIQATMQDVSTNGARLLLPDKVEAGAAGLLEVFRPSRNVHVALDVVVVYVIKRAQGDFVTGTAFARPLPEDEVRGLL